MDRDTAPLILKLRTRWGKWLTSRPVRFYPGEENPDTH